jgi:hypothetical protein
MTLDGLRAELYRHRAAEVRAVAKTFHDPAVKEQLENVAREYEALAISVDPGLLSH